MIRSPSRELVRVVYSNYDHVLNEDVANELLGDPNVYAGHAAWNFYGRVWYEDGQWTEQVWCYGCPVMTLRGTDLAALIELVNAEYGSD